MTHARTSDVIFLLDENSTLVEDSLRAVLSHDRDLVGRVIVIDGRRHETPNRAALGTFALDPRFVLIETEGSFAELVNRGLRESRGDAAVIGSECLVAEGWLAELAAVAHLEERTACVSPISNATDLGLVPELDYLMGRWVDPAIVKAACSPLPRATTTPVLSASCFYFRGDLLPAVGFLDETSRTRGAVLADWVARAESLGLMAKRANHVYVPSREPAERERMVSAESPESIISLRQSSLERRIERFRSSLDGRIVDHAVRLAAGERLRLAYDLRHLPADMVGTRTLAVSLARALAELPEIDLTLLVRTPAQARGLVGRVVRADEWADDVQVIHRPAQVVDPGELGLLFQSSAHLVVTYLDLIGYRTPLVFASDSEYERYRSTSNLCLPALQRVVAMSENAAREIVAEFEIPREDVEVVPLGVDSSWFSARSPGDSAVRRRLKLPAQYFFSLATDFPHKNLHALLEAHEILRDRWPDSDPPSLILAGYKNGGRFGLYPNHGSHLDDNGVVFLGPVSPDQLRILYQNAIALVYPSLYEGFGLPPLEAMAAGAPVIAMPISSVPEVAGPAAFYPPELSAKGLAEAMARVALDHDLRDDLRARGLKHVEHFRWDRMAREMLKVYRSVVRNPSHRSLSVRRLTQDGLVRWSEHLPESSSELGIKTAWRALNQAFHTRIKREIQRLPIKSRGQSA